MMSGALLAFAATLFICCNAENIAHALGVIDHPDHGRKSHIEATPLVGGIAILVPLLLWLGGKLLSDSPINSALYTALLVSGGGVAAVGLADDQTSISPSSRLIAITLFLLLALLIDPQLVAPSLSWASLADFPIPAWLSIALAVLSAVGIVNAMNMADGQNGLVPSLFVIWSGCLILVGDSATVAVAQALFGLSLVTLFFNLRGKLFLGSCGSYGVSFTLGTLTMLAHAQGRIAIETIVVLLFIPVVDCLRLLVARLLRGRSPMAPDTDHFHHRLRARFGSQYGLAAYLGIVAASSLIAVLAPRLSLVCIVVLTAIYMSFASLTESEVMRTSNRGPGGRQTRETRPSWIGATSVSRVDPTRQRDLI